jgi:exosome complex exonuclease RRP6
MRQWKVAVEFCATFFLDIVDFFADHYNHRANHPYRYEITHLTYPSRMFETCNPIPPPSLDDTEATWVSTPEDFQQMLAKLKNATEIAVDLEHHSYRSYSGFLCLLQISDRNEDWVVDLLAVRDEVELLNEVFTDPNIVKVRYMKLVRVNNRSRFS